MLPQSIKVGEVRIKRVHVGGHQNEMIGKSALMSHCMVYWMWAYSSVTLPGCWIRPGLQFGHMLWKANTSVNHLAELQTPMTETRQNNWKSPESTETSHQAIYPPHPGMCLISRTHFYIYEITNSGLWNPKCPNVELVGNRLLMQTWFQCQPWRCPL